MTMKRSSPSGFFLGLIASLAVWFAPSIYAENESVLCRGRVLLRDGGGVVPMTTGRVGASDEGGQMYESAAIQPDGTYELNVRANQRSIIQVLLREYSFEPARIIYFPDEDRQIREFVATLRRPGSIEVSVKRHPKASSDAKLDDERFAVTDADTGRLMSTFRLDRQGKFRVTALEGTKIIIEPKSNQGLQWIPPKFVTTITRRAQKTEFVYLFSTEVGTGDLNLSRDRTRVPDTVGVSLQLVDLNRGKLLIGDEVELQARPGRDAPDDSVYSFLIKYDAERNFRTLANRQSGTSVRFTLDRPGGFEAKVALIANGAILGGAATRNYALASPTDKAPGVKLHDPTNDLFTEGWGAIDDLPQVWHVDLRFSIDQVAGPMQQPRRLQLDAWVKQDLSSHRLPRLGRRLTFMVRHEDDSRWTIINQNIPTLEWSWTPPRQGKWTLRVDYVMPDELKDDARYPDYTVGGRAQISFTAMGPSAVSSSSAGLAADTAPSPRPKFRPVATPAPRPAVRPVPMATPKSGPRPILRPVATPKAQWPSRPALRPVATPTPKPSPRPKFQPMPR